MLQIIPIPAFEDNYIWLMHQHGQAIVVDPGDALPVINYLTQHQIKLDTILITHHHNDHIGGVETLLKTYSAKVYAPAKEQYIFPHIPVNEGDTIPLENHNLCFNVLEVPGHTLGHVAYYGANYLFCGDTLFGAGCGRLFEGTPEQMYQSLQKLASLPENTAVYCTHEYTERNIEFALSLEPNNQNLAIRANSTKQLRLMDNPTLPSTIGLELATNPFLRCKIEEIQHSSGAKSHQPLAVFTAIRQLRNQF